MPSRRRGGDGWLRAGADDAHGASAAPGGRSGGLSAVERAEYTAAFRRIDADGSGVVDEVEMRAAMGTALGRRRARAIEARREIAAFFARRLTRTATVSSRSTSSSARARHRLGAARDAAVRRAAGVAAASRASSSPRSRGALSEEPGDDARQAADGADLPADLPLVSLRYAFGTAPARSNEKIVTIATSRVQVHAAVEPIVAVVQASLALWDAIRTAIVAPFVGGGDAEPPQRRPRAAAARACASSSRRSRRGCYSSPTRRPAHRRARRAAARALSIARDDGAGERAGRARPPHDGALAARRQARARGRSRRDVRARR